MSLFPEMFQAITAHGVTGRAFEAGLWQLACFNPRDYSNKPYRSVDDKVYGGGPGVVLSPEPLAGALRAAKAAFKGARVVYVSPQGQRLTQEKLQVFAKAPSMIWLSGRYEGIDERIIETFVDEEVSIGDYVLSGGELAVMVALDGILRLLPGVLGHAGSLLQESFVSGLLDYPHYTRPPVFEGLKVPEVLLAGDHAAIATWRLQQALRRTAKRRPDVLAHRTLSEKERCWLEDEDVT